MLLAEGGLHASLFSSFLHKESQRVSTNKTVKTNYRYIQSFKVSEKIFRQIFHNSYLSLTLSSAVSISIGKWEEMKVSKLVKSKLID